MLIRFLILRIFPLGMMLYGTYLYQSEMLEYYYKAKDVMVAMQVSSNMKTMSKVISLSLQNDENIGDITSFLKRRVKIRGSKSYLDQWGNRYRFEKDYYGNYLFSSCGPDGSCGTDDDIVIKIKGF